MVYRVDGFMALFYGFSTYLPLIQPSMKLEEAEGLT